MELKPGYKQTEVGIIPEDWEVVALGAICSMKSGEGITSAKIDWFSRYPCYGGNGLRGFTSRFTHDGSYALIGRQGALCGNVLGVEGKFFASEHAVIVTVHPQTDIRWLTYVLGEMHLNRFSESSAQPGLSVSKVLKLGLAFPPTKAEQDAIAKALGDVDALIGALRRLIAKKRDLKQAAMQQLLTGQTRLPGFSGEWEVRRLGEIGSFSKGKGIRKDDVVPEGLPCLRYGEIYTHHNEVVRSFFSFIPLEVAKQSQPLRKGDLLFAGSGETAEEIGKCVAFLEDVEAYAGGDIVILSPVGQDSMYLGYLMNHTSVVEQKARLGQGDAVVHISARHLAQLIVRLPEAAEQTAIAAVLSDMDSEIAGLEQRLAKTRALKQGMMQELLTGRIRLV